MYHGSRPGWIEIITGVMFSGKSEELIRRLRRAEIAKQKVQVFKPKIDDRYAVDHVVSHSDMRIKSEIVSHAAEILGGLKAETEVVGIDEGQFFDGTITEVVQARMAYFEAADVDQNDMLSLQECMAYERQRRRLPQ